MPLELTCKIVNNAFKVFFHSCVYNKNFPMRKKLAAVLSSVYVCNHLICICMQSYIYIPLSLCVCLPCDRKFNLHKELKRCLTEVGRRVNGEVTMRAVTTA